MATIELRRVETDDDLVTCMAIWDAITPDDPADIDLVRARNARDSRRLHVLAELDGQPVGCGFAGPSQTEGRGAVAPRVLPPSRRRGVGTVLLVELVRHLETLAFATASAHVDGNDPGSLAFATRFGFAETDRQIEQVKTLGDEPSWLVPDGVSFVTVAERPELLRDSYELAEQGYAGLATVDPVTVSLEEWLEEEAQIPEGSFVALAGGEIVGYTGLTGSTDSVVFDGLTVVRRDWRRRGLALQLKRAKLAWAAAAGIREIVTWTQTGNDGMRAVNERLGYVYRDVSLSVAAPLPLDGLGELDT